MPCRVSWKSSVVLDQMTAQVVSSLGHRPRVAMERRLGAEHRVHLGEIHCRDRVRIEARPVSKSASADPGTREAVHHGNGATPGLEPTDPVR